MRKPPLFALGMCAAAFLGQVSLTFADQAQTSGLQSAARTQQTGKQASTSNAQSATIPQTSKTTSSSKAQLTLPSRRTDRPPSAQKSQPAPTNQQTEKQASGAKTQAARPPAIPPGYRLLNLNEGREIAQGMSWADDEEGLAPDCSHLVHHLYEQAGYSYPYASSLDLYRGTGPFFQVRYAHPGDLVVWRGHVGIVVNPQEHSFFSTSSSGARVQSYRSAYWRARGYPHFFRYLTKSPPKNGGASEASNHTPELQPATPQSHASKSPSSQPALKQKDPRQP